MRQRLHYDHLIIAAAVLIGFVAGTQPLNDNSLLVHLRTGMSILHTHHIPHSDPYSFSAHGQPWVVESWGAELVYAIFIKIGGAHVLQLFNAVLYATTAGVIAKMCRTNNLGRTLLNTLICVGIGFSMWSPRPTMFGLLFFVLTVLIVQKRASFLWFIPLGLLWVNMHATWPLGFLWIALSGIGARLDKENTDPYLKYAAAFVFAVLLGGLLSPAGSEVLAFPTLGFGARSAVFRGIVEWQSPNFTNGSILGSRVILITLLAAVVILARHKQKWSVVLPALMLFGAAFLGQRNFPFLGAGLAPLLASVLIRPLVPAEADVRRIITVGSVAFLICSVLYSAGGWTRDPYNLKPYPVAAINWLDQNHMIGPGHRVATPDLVGCYMIFRFGTNANVFMDDRYDMYPIQVAQDSLGLLRLPDNTLEILERYNFESVLFERDSSISQYLAINPNWKVVWGDKSWQIFQHT